MKIHTNRFIILVVDYVNMFNNFHQIKKKFTDIAQMQCTETVSYTHLDVYKRQV